MEDAQAKTFLDVFMSEIEEHTGVTLTKSRAFLEKAEGLLEEAEKVAGAADAELAKVAANQGMGATAQSSSPKPSTPEAPQPTEEATAENTVAK